LTVREYQYFVVLLVTAAVTYLLTPLVRRAAIRIGAVPAARERDVHVEPIPRMGGLAMYFGVAAGLLAATEIPAFRSSVSTNAPGMVNGLLLAGALIVVIGVIDDKWGMNALAKAAGQVAAAGVLVASGAQLSFFPLPKEGEFALTYNEGVVLTILVVVATINAVNFIDGLDGLAAGIVFIAAISFFIYYYSLTKVVGLTLALPAAAVPAMASVVIAGACLGFLPHNFHPAKIFMGDTGAMLLGLLLAYVPISALSSIDPIGLQNRANRFPEILPLLLPAAVMVIPYTDMLRAVIRRVRAGQSPFAADNKHLHHRMLEIGHSHRSSVLILYAWAALFAAVVVGLSIVTAPLAVLAATTLIAVLVLVLLSIPRLRWWQRRGAPAPARQARPAPATPRPAVVRPEPAGGLASFSPAPHAAPQHALGNGGLSPHRVADSLATLPSLPEAGAMQDQAADTAPMQLPRRASGSIIP
jgi:UDP-GlcNAc:undecaprenyl-phosphate/decaprenyl-phosphate GlcNAc-1-phosphate transferase